MNDLYLKKALNTIPLDTLTPLASYAANPHRWSGSIPVAHSEIYRFHDGKITSQQKITKEQHQIKPQQVIEIKRLSKRLIGLDFNPAPRSVAQFHDNVGNYIKKIDAVLDIVTGKVELTSDHDLTQDLLAKSLTYYFSRSDFSKAQNPIPMTLDDLNQISNDQSLKFDNDPGAPISIMNIDSVLQNYKQSSYMINFKDFLSAVETADIQTRQFICHEIEYQQNFIEGKNSAYSLLYYYSSNNPITLLALRQLAHLPISEESFYDYQDTVKKLHEHFVVQKPMNLRAYANGGEFGLIEVLMFATERGYFDSINDPMTAQRIKEISEQYHHYKDAERIMLITARILNGDSLEGIHPSHFKPIYRRLKKAYEEKNEVMISVYVTQIIDQYLKPHYYGFIIQKLSNQFAFTLTPVLITSYQTQRRNYVNTNGQTHSRNVTTYYIENAHQSGLFEPVKNYNLSEFDFTPQVERSHMQTTVYNKYLESPWSEQTFAGPKVLELYRSNTYKLCDRFREAPNSIPMAQLILSQFPHITDANDVNTSLELDELYYDSVQHHEEGHWDGEMRYAVQAQHHEIYADLQAIAHAKNPHYTLFNQFNRVTGHNPQTNQFGIIKLYKTDPETGERKFEGYKTQQKHGEANIRFFEHFAQDTTVWVTPLLSEGQKFRYIYHENPAEFDRLTRVMEAKLVEMSADEIRALADKYSEWYERWERD